MPSAVLLAALIAAAAVAPDALLTTSAPLLPETASLDEEGVIPIAGVTSPLTIDLGATRGLVALVLQADGDDVYSVDASLDGSTWRTIWRAPRVEGGRAGLRTRAVRLPQPVQARLLAVRPTVGTPPFGVARLYPLESLPAAWPPPLDYSRPASRPPRFAAFTPRVVQALKGLLGVAAMLVLAVRMLERRHGLRTQAWCRPALLAIAVLSVLAWTNFLNFHYTKGFVHLSDTYHYYVAAKYFPELGYDGLYTCSAAAETDDGHGDDVRARTLRDLATDAVISAAPWADHPETCRQRFGPERWSAFRRDVGFFREAMGPADWAVSQTDHGFNATPVWVMTGGLLTRTGPATWSQVLLVCSLDVALLLALFLVLAAGFGWEAACTAAIFFGINGLARFSWTGGALLRYDWLLLLGLGCVAFKAERPALAGFLSAWSALIRIFPAFVFLGIGLAALLDSIASRSTRPLRPALRTAAGAALAIIVLVPASVLTAGRAGAWSDFANNTRRFVQTEAENFVGLQVAVTFFHTPSAELSIDPVHPDPYAEWRRLHAESARQDRPLLVLAAVAGLVLLGAAARGRPLWVAALLGLGSVPLVFKLGNYYYAWLALFGALAAPSAGAACGLAALAWATHVAADTWATSEAIGAATSLLVVAFVVTLTAAFAWPAGRER